MIHKNRDVDGVLSMSSVIFSHQDCFLEERNSCMASTSADNGIFQQDAQITNL